MSQIKPSNSRPLLMSAPMIRALKKGWKKATRRVVKPMTKDVDEPWPNQGSHVTLADILEHLSYFVEAGYCPYGRVLDTLWIKETWQIRGWSEYYQRALINFAADEPGESSWLNVPPGQAQWLEGQAGKLKARYTASYSQVGQYQEYVVEGMMPWKSSLFMPKWASRFLLEIRDVDMALLQSMNAHDAIKEGIDKAQVIQKLRRQMGSVWSPDVEAQAYINEFSLIWDSLQENVEEAGFGANPYVWELTFEEVKP